MISCSNLIKTVLFLLGLGITGICLAQNEGDMPKIPEGVAEADPHFIAADGGPVKQSRVEPPFWWVNMKNPQLQVLVYDQDIGDFEVQIDHPGVQLTKVHRVQNPNYLFIDLEIGPGTQPGIFPIVLQKGDITHTYPYELKKRLVNPEEKQGLSPADLIYLIMPDRFANGDPGNDSIPQMKQRGVDRSNVFFRHGGDLIGVMQHLDYLEELGVTAIWLNPVLENDQPYESYHGYAITDHYRIDPRFGTNTQYRQLVRMCHERGIKVIMDIIHNHVGDQHWFIQDLPDEDWIHQYDSFTKTTYRAPTLMDPYASRHDQKLMSNGWFDRHMPDLNQKHPLLATYLIQNNIWWTEFSGHDAYRVDTYAYSDQGFMSQWGKHMQEEFPTFDFFGETWVHGLAVQAQFTQDNHLREGYNSHLPAVTDYQLYYALTEALSREQGWTDGVSRIYYTLAQDFLYKDPFQNILFLDNHDLARFFSQIGEDEKKFRSGIAFLLTMRGTPMLFYGTEILMTGVGGAFGEAGRGDFPGGWRSDSLNKFKPEGRNPNEQAAWEYVKRLANYRKETSALQDGQLVQFVPEDGIYVYFRFDQHNTVMVIMNTNNEPKTVDTQRYAERMRGFSQALEIGNNMPILDISQIKIDRNTTLVLELIP